MYRLALVALVACSAPALPTHHGERVASVYVAPDAGVPDVAVVPTSGMPSEAVTDSSTEAPSEAVTEAPNDASTTASADASAPFASAAFAVEVRGQGRPVILIPGLGCPASVWDTTVAHLSQTAQTHVLSLAGFAGQPAISEPLEASVRAELARYIRETGLDHPVVIGHSLGGVIAFWLAASEPDLVGPTIIVDAAPQMFPDVRPAAVQARADRWRRMTDAQFAAAVAEYFGSMSNNRAAIAAVIAAVARSDRRAFADAIVELATIDLRGTLAAIRAPVLAIVADGQGFAQAVSRQIAPIPDHRVAMVRGARHFVFFDEPEPFFREVDAFLAEHPWR